MEPAMTTFARGMSAPKRVVAFFTRTERSAADRRVVAEAGRELRSAITAPAAERMAMGREQAWIDRATFAAMRMHPRG
jgi:hypothetical protein